MIDIPHNNNTQQTAQDVSLFLSELEESPAYPEIVQGLTKSYSDIPPDNQVDFCERISSIKEVCATISRKPDTLKQSGAKLFRDSQPLVDAWVGVVESTPGQSLTVTTQSRIQQYYQNPNPQNLVAMTQVILQERPEEEPVKGLGKLVGNLAQLTSYWIKARDQKATAGNAL